MTGVAELMVNEGERAERPISIDSSNTYKILIELSPGCSCYQLVATDCSAEGLVS
jgi:hypothetical protein